MSKDYYKTLGVEKNANAEEIKKAFRKKAHKYHPDKSTGDEAKFKEANEAYQVLGDQKKRQQYDQFGTSFSGSGPSGMGGFDGVNINMDDLGDIFGGMGDIFGFGGRPSATNRPAHGGDLQLMMKIDFREAVFGVEKEISVQKTVDCSICKGSGAEPGSSIDSCNRCGGRGRVNAIQNTVFGQVQTQVTCPDCDGEGKKYSKKCVKCSGVGIHRDNVKLKIKIPAGIDDQETIKISGQGNAGVKGGRVGDMYIKISVSKDRKFTRDGYDIFSKEEISMSQAILGDKINIETIEGAVKLKIPEGTQPRTIFNLKDKGIHKLRGRGKGNHLVEVIVKVPKGLSKKQRKIVEDLGI